MFCLQLRCERFVEELESYAKQVEEFLTFGEISELSKYLKKAQALNSKLETAMEKVVQCFMSNLLNIHQITDLSNWLINLGIYLYSSDSYCPRIVRTVDGALCCFELFYIKIAYTASTGI